jgi:GNAT superfamily N-acetyltransferase
VSRALPDGLVLRPATPADLPQAAELLVARGEPADGADLRLVASSEGLDGIAVVVEGDRVVSTATLLDEVVHLGGPGDIPAVAIPSGQVELVATDPAYEGRGLVRALMSWAHARSRDRGHLLQVMIGIPYFYRRFGYAYAMPMSTWHELARVPEAPAEPSDVEVRRATLGDIPAMDVLQAQAQGGADVWMPHSLSCWRWLVERDGSEQWLVVRAGEPVGVARVVPGEDADDPTLVAELAATDEEAALAIVAAAAGGAMAGAGRFADAGGGVGAGGGVELQRRVGIAPGLDARLGPPAEPAEWYYGRVERLGPVLTHLAPVLLARLDAAGLGEVDHEVLLSTWATHARFTVGPSGFQLVVEGGPEQAPIHKGGSGIPPDALAPLLLGPYGALGLEERLPDCLLGAQREVMAALFPPMTADLLTFYLSR